MNIKFMKIKFGEKSIFIRWGNIAPRPCFELDPFGIQYWSQNGSYFGKLHRDGDLPAIIWPDGTKEWWKNGLRHRDGDKPAIIYADGTKKWYKNGVQYKEVTFNI